MRVRGGVTPSGKAERKGGFRGVFGMLRKSLRCRAAMSETILLRGRKERTMKAVKDKIRFALWLKPETMEKIRTASAQDDCGSLSEFIVAESDHRHASMLFKLSVERRC